MTHIIAIANAKGGVAKTTTSLSLGAMLAETGQRVLLVDLDPHANLTISLGLRPPSLELTLADVLLGAMRIDQIICQTSQEGLDLVPANHDLQLAESHLIVRENYEMVLSDALKLTSGYDTVLLDCPPTLGTLTHNALAAAELLIIPTQPEYFSAHALRDMLNMILTIRSRHNPKLRYRILLTMLDRRNRIHSDLAVQIRTAFNQATFKTEIETDTRLRESPVFGQPINQYAPSSRASTQYRELAQELGKTFHEL
ncbi:MAG: ParA family protein [Anaerolineales bacterium]|jgi:chromosome partitioning protein